jgi:hypothetical protein
MANESSAIVQLISTAQQEHHAIADSSRALPDFTDDLKPIRRSYKVPLLIVGGLLLAGGAALAGVFYGKNYLGESDGAEADMGATAGRSTPSTPVSPSPAAPSAAPAEPVASAVPEPPGTAPAGPAGSAAPPPSVASAPVPDPAPSAPASPSAAPPAPSPSAATAPLTPEVLAATGFDIRVKPQATITLDGRVLGKSPLRVRNLTPGAHVVDIEAPAGFFSRRVELELDAGEPQNVNLALDAIDPVDEVAEAGVKKKSKVVKKSRREKRRAKRNKARRSRSKPRGEVAKALAIPDEEGGATATGLGTLMIGSKPPCDIYIDGENTGLKTPQRAIELGAGTHQVTLVNTELDIKKTFTVKIRSGKRTRAIHDLTGKI